MHKTATKFLLVFICLTACAAVRAFAQATITIGTIDPGPYGPGSTIAVPFHIDDSGGCLPPTGNTFQLLMSNRSGVFTSTTPVATLDPNTFYATFINYTVPAGITAGTNYQFKIVATNNGTPITSGPSNPGINIGTAAGLAAGIGSTAISGTYSTPANIVFGACSSPQSSYFFTNSSAATATSVTASFFNEGAQTMDAAGIDITNAGYNFNTTTTNYTVTVKAINAGGVVGTRAYQIINNQINTTIGATGNPSVCIQGGVAPLTKNIDYTSASGIENNYPGNTYTFTWGDGTSNTYTLCQIKALSGQITHNYTAASCGNTANGQVNSFEVDFSASNVYCGRIGSTQSSYSKIVIAPTNGIGSTTDPLTPPATGCTGTAVTFVNHSVTGPDPNATTSSCSTNPNAQYIWLVDGVIVAQNFGINQNFIHTFNTNGNHTVTLRASNNNSAGCTAADRTITICIQNPPQPAFTLPASPYCMTSGPITPTNLSVIDPGCIGVTPAPQETWTITPNTFTFVGGTTKNSISPQINFTAPGIYTFKLGIAATGGCSATTTPTQTLVVNNTPTATLSQDYSECGSNKTLSFDGTAGSNTHTVFTGTAQALATTYTWTVTGGAFTFAGGTNLNSEFPKINFTDFATYAVSVTHTNNCGTVTTTQSITFQNAPSVTATSSQPTICQGDVIHLTGNISGASTSHIWSTTTGGTFTDATSLTPDYTPSATDISNGSVTINFQVTTSLTGVCHTITSSVTVSIIPTDRVTNTTNVKTICSGQQVGYALTASNPGSTFAWTATLTSGTATGFTTPGSGGIINDVITNTDPTTDAVITYTITPTSGTCPGTLFTFTVTVPALPVVTPTAANAAFCSGGAAGISLASNQTGTKYTWTVTAPAGVTGTTAVSTATSNTTITDILKNTGSTNATVTYTITPYNTAGCAGSPVPVSITVYPQPVQANAGADVAICNATSYVLQGNTPAFGSGLWTVVTGTGLSFDDATNAHATVSGLSPGNSYELKWTISSTSATCQTSDDVIITVDIPTVGGTTATADPTTVCAGSNSGTISLSGQTGNILNWESSIDNGTTWQPITNSTASLTFLNLTRTTQYRAEIQNGSCAITPSTVTTITVNAVAPVANAGPSQTFCGATTVTLAGNDPGTFAGLWTQTGGPTITFTDATKYNTTVTGLVQGNTYTFVWSIASLAPCPSTQSQTQVIDNADIVPSFTTSPKSGCGDLSVQFINTSNNQGNATFLWTFGDGSAQSNAVSPAHIFPQRLDGRDTIYHITLSVLGNCTPHPPAVDSVLVRPAVPVARILPNSLNGCGSFALDVQNISPGNNTSYDFYLYDGATLVQKITKTDKSNAIFDAITVTAKKTYITYMIATGYCNNTTETTHIPITISPATITAQMFIQNNVNRGCAPLSLTFINNSAGGDNFVYNIYDKNKKLIDQPIAGTAPLPYVLDSVGVFYVSITASNGCGSNESPLTRLDIFAIPTPDFVADTTTACKDILVRFTNKTVTNDLSTAPTSLSYDWDFGDGSTHSASFTPPPHAYHFANSPYTVTLTATNTTSGCSNIAIKRAYIVLTGPPAPDFIEKPDSVTVLPNYTFSFSDESTGGAVSWSWKTSDGQTSTQKNPTITFPDTGTYKVTLLASNAKGCDSAVSHNVRINGVPGQLYLPNAFIPTSLSSEIKVFMAKGSGIKTWHLQIFNKYGQLVWETDKLSNKGEPIDGWDGTFNGVPAPQGVYVWQASATFINGSEWKGNTYNKSAPKRTGSVHLIR